ncbi:tyrosine recombinase XerD [Stackebrandtia nassauensis DSM 44728]|uniref:Tyrosine recombinase XerC n=1 Tax=Stackebrandtia nassauensis (strain DSM 44728 / CIP 108903 / NRRL B-16338 / NBRC 102104 / LLR-40K-21) TaxID=446470 RepID=D3Q525_STANL|nr:site-specific tyrosine recombinase [Stackebrandtia nassauensis]ADD44074.1 tyrosine recombinase XerD [Stackebrandtia nassauensis DSM 44728]
MPARVVRDYLDHVTVERGHSANTIAAYRRDLGRYLDWLSETGLDALSQVTAADIGGYLARLSQGDDEHPGLSARSIARATSALRGLHRFALDEGVTDTDPTQALSTPKPALRLPKAIGVDEVARLLEAAAILDNPTGLRDTALVEFLYGTGARVSETIGADIDDLDFDAAAVRLRGKGGKVRVVPLGGYAVRALENYLTRARPSWTPGHPKLFVNSRGKPLTRQGVFFILRGLADRAGMAVDLGPHTLRHSFATHLLDGGADIRVVQELLGHAAVSTTQIYTLVTVDKLREVYATSHPRAR